MTSAVDPTTIFVNNEIIRQIQVQFEIVKAELDSVLARLAVLEQEEQRERKDRTVSPRKKSAPTESTVEGPKT